MYFPFKKHCQKLSLYSQNLEQCFIYTNIIIYVYISTHTRTHTHQDETNRKNPNLIIYPRMSFWLFLPTIHYVTPDLLTLPCMIQALLCLCAISSAWTPSPTLLVKLRTLIQPKDQLKVTPGKRSYSFFCAL